MLRSHGSIVVSFISDESTLDSGVADRIFSPVERQICSGGSLRRVASTLKIRRERALAFFPLRSVPSISTSPTGSHQAIRYDQDSAFFVMPKFFAELAW